MLDESREPVQIVKGSLVPENSQRTLAEQAIGAEKPHDQCEAHRQPQPDEQYLQMQHPGQFKNESKKRPGQGAGQSDADQASHYTQH